MPQILTIIIKGGIVMIPLLACSLISLALSIERILFWTRLKSRAVINEILALVEKGEYEQALKLGKNSPQPIARVLAAGIAHRNPAPAKAMEAAAQGEFPVLKSRIGILDTIVTLAPLLGLLGTVVGMIGSFDVMADGGIGQPHAEGVGRAVAFSLALASRAVAGEPEKKEDTFNLPPVVVQDQGASYVAPESTLSKFPVPLQDTPQSVTIVPEKLFRNRPAPHCATRSATCPELPLPPVRAVVTRAMCLPSAVSTPATIPSSMACVIPAPTSAILQF